MLIKELVTKYMNNGYNYRNAQNLAAEEIILTKIASSSLSENITLKGGIVMFNLTKSDRRVTQDIDFDFIRYSISDDSIKLFVRKLNSVEDSISATIVGNIEKLHQEDYQGVRVYLLLEDSSKTNLNIKLDIGVHTYTAIEQEKILFTFLADNDAVSIKVNPCEQVFVEKLISMARLGPISARYKDIYDMYYLIHNSLLDLNKTKSILNLLLSSTKRQPNNILDLTNSVIDTLNNKNYSKEAGKMASKWLDVKYEEVKSAIINFINKL